MHANRNASAQQSRVRLARAESDATGFFNLLTSEALFEQVERLLPPHRERLFPPTETLAMFCAQALNADRSCQRAVDTGKRGQRELSRRPAATLETIDADPFCFLCRFLLDEVMVSGG